MFRVFGYDCKSSPLAEKEEPTMSERNMLGGALAEVAGPFKDFAEKLGGDQGEQWLEAFKRFLRKEEPWPSFPVWKTVKLGVNPETVKNLRYALEHGDYKISCFASKILSRITIARKPVELDLVVLTTTELTGKKEGGTTAEVFAGAARLALEKCPAEVGPRVRLQYLDQSNGERVIVGMEPILDSDGHPSVFFVGRGYSELWLRSYWAYPGGVWGPGSLWVFVRPRK